MDRSFVNARINQGWQEQFCGIVQLSWESFWSTVRTHICSIYGKGDVWSWVQAVALWGMLLTLRNFSIHLQWSWTFNFFQVVFERRSQICCRCVAALLGAEVILTDLFDRLRLLQKNVTENTRQFGSQFMAKVQELTWGEELDESLTTPSPDFGKFLYPVIASCLMEVVTHFGIQTNGLVLISSASPSYIHPFSSTWTCMVCMWYCPYQNTFCYIKFSVGWCWYQNISKLCLAADAPTLPLLDSAHPNPGLALQGWMPIIKYLNTGPWEAAPFRLIHFACRGRTCS